MPKTTLVFGLSTIFILLAATILLLFNYSDRPTSPPNNQLVVAATIFPLVDITQQIAGLSIQVVQLIPSNSTPHSFSLTPQQIRQLTHVQSIFAIGHGLDDRVINSALKLNPYPVVTVDQNISLHPFNLEHDDPDHNPDSPASSNLDPHYWLTTPNAKLIATTIAHELIRLDPAHSTNYESNLTVYLDQLDQLEQTLQQQANTATQSNFIAIHNAWSYFAEQYHFSLIASYEPFEGRTPTITDIQHLQQLIKQYQIKTFFTEPQKTTSAGTRLMQQEFGLTIKTLDPIGGLVPDDSYIQLMSRNIQALTDNN